MHLEFSIVQKFLYCKNKGDRTIAVQDSEDTRQMKIVFTVRCVPLYKARFLEIIILQESHQDALHAQTDWMEVESSNSTVVTDLK